MKVVAVFWLAGLFMFIVMAREADADSISVNAFLTRTESITESAGTTTTSSTSTENYVLSFNKSLTGTIKFNGDIRATRTVSDDIENSTISPTLFLRINNEYFVSGVGYQIIENVLSTGSKLTSILTNANFSTSPAGIPSLSVSYNDTLTVDNLPVHQADTQTSIINATTNYSIFNLRMTYNFSGFETTDRVSQIKRETPAHFASLGYSNSFFDNRIGISLNYGTSKSDSTITSLTGVPRFFDEKKEALNGLFEIDMVPEDGRLADNCDECFALIDDNKESNTGINLNEKYRNIGVRLNKKERITKIYLYVSTTEEDIASIDLKWRAFFTDNNIAGARWTIIAQSSSYDEINHRFVFDFTSPVEAAFFKVVNTGEDPFAKEINVTEIEAIGSSAEQVTTEDTTTQDRQFIGINLRFQPTEKLSLIYNGNFDTTQQRQDNSKSENVNQGISLSYILSESLSLSTNYQYQKTSFTTTPSTASNNYVIALSSNPIEAVNGTASIIYTENFEDDKVIINAYSVNLNTFLYIYTGLTLGAGLSFSESEDIKKESTTTANSITGNLYITPRESINILVNGTFTAETTDEKGDTTDTSSDNLLMTINYNPSRHISLSADIKFLPQARQDYSINTTLPGNLQVLLGYGRADSGAETLSGNIYWNISRYLALSLVYTLIEANNETDDRSSNYNLSLLVTR